MFENFDKPRITDSRLSLSFSLSSRAVKLPMAVDSPANEQHKYLSGTERKTYDIRRVGENEKKKTRITCLDLDSGCEKG